jgi:hypothetical protein
MSRTCRVELPVGFGNRWKTTRTNVASRDTAQGRAFGQVIDFVATPAGFEPATLSLEGLLAHYKTKIAETVDLFSRIKSTEQLTKQTPDR